MRNEQVAEAFANGETKGASGTMFIETAGGCPVVYSYGHHFPIAMLVLGGTFAYFNTDSYSHTTGRHKGYVRRALEARGILFQKMDTDKLKEMVANKI